MTWIAQYNDGSVLLEVDENGNEHLFKDIDQDKLKQFIFRDNNYIIGVDITNGTILLNNAPIEIEGISRLDVKYRLIYFKRVSVDIGTRTISDNKTVKPFVGFQTTINGVNKKVMISLSDVNFKVIVE